MKSRFIPRETPLFFLAALQDSSPPLMKRTRVRFAIAPIQFHCVAINQNDTMSHPKSVQLLPFPQLSLYPRLIRFIVAVAQKNKIHPASPLNHHHGFYIGIVCHIFYFTIPTPKQLRHMDPTNTDTELLTRTWRATMLH